MAFCAPEVLSLGANDKTHYDGKAADVWSCGVCLFAMVTGKLPFTDERNNQAETIKVPSSSGARFTEGPRLPAAGGVWAQR